jgi:galactose mutarotase-like enzyme
MKKYTDLLFAMTCGLLVNVEHGLQFYSGNFLTRADLDVKGKIAYPYHSAFCLETQHFPDSPMSIVPNYSVKAWSYL